MFVPFAAPQLQPPNPAEPAAHCLRLLTRLAVTGAAFVRRLCAHRRRAATPRGRHRANALLYRVHIALTHLRILTGKLAADAAYRGEPPRPARPAAAAPAQPHAARRQPRRRARPRPYEQVFAGRSIGQIVDRIRRDLGLPVRIGPHLDELLTRRPRPPDPPPHRRCFPRTRRRGQPRAQRIATLQPRPPPRARTPPPPATTAPAARSPPPGAQPPATARRPSSARDFGG